jgi:hypothetical protein
VVRPVDIPLVVTGQGADAGVIAASALASVRYLEQLAYVAHENEVRR